MAYLILSRGKKVVMGVSFESPDDEAVVQSASPEVREAMIEELRGDIEGVVSLDAVASLAVMPMATMTIVSRAPGIADVPLFMTADELRRHIAEATAVLKTMESAGEAVDKHMATYREHIRRRAMESETGE